MSSVQDYNRKSTITTVRIPRTNIPSVRTTDMLLNPQLLIPPRPTISNIQWISGTQYVTPADMDLLSMSLSCTCTFPFCLTISSRRPKPPSFQTPASPSPRRTRTRTPCRRPRRPRLRFFLEPVIPYRCQYQCPESGGMGFLGDASVQRKDGEIESGGR
jgi:hypothetical protein